MRITRESVQSDYRELSNVLGYLGDWPVVSSSPEGALEVAIAELPHATLLAAREQLQRVLKQVEDDVDLRRVLNDCFGVNVHFGKAKETRRFADIVDARLGTVKATK